MYHIRGTVPVICCAYTLFGDRKHPADLSLPNDHPSLFSAKASLRLKTESYKVLRDNIFASALLIAKLLLVKTSYVRIQEPFKRNTTTEFKSAELQKHIQAKSVLIKVPNISKHLQHKEISVHLKLWSSRHCLMLNENTYQLHWGLPYRYIQLVFNL